MDYESRIGVTYLIVIATFLQTWRFSPFNPAFTFYPGMVMGADMVFSCIFAVVAIAVVVLIWLFN